MSRDKCLGNRVGEKVNERGFTTPHRDIKQSGSL